MNWFMPADDLADFATAEAITNCPHSERNAFSESSGKNQSTSFANLRAFGTASS
jgi:hypothetical protein